MRSFDSLALRQMRSRPLRSALTGFGVVLGVGMVFGVLLLVGTIRATWDDVIGSAFSQTDIVISPEAGTLPEDSLTLIRATTGVRDAAGMAGMMLTRLDEHGKPIEGIKGQIMVAGYEPGGFQPYDFKIVEGREMQSGTELALDRDWAEDHGVEVGERLPVATLAGARGVPVVGLFEVSGGASMGLGFAAMPLEAARAMMDLPPGWMMISVAAEEGVDVGELSAMLRRRLPEGVKVQTPQAVSADAASQTDAMNVVLYFFSGIALFVGAFLILNSFNMTVLQRMREIGMLRTLGATRRRIMRTVLLEAGITALAGSALGLLLGFALAAGLVALMRGLGLPIGDLEVSSGPALTAFAIGMVVTMAAAWWPARRAGRISPMRAVLGTTGVRRKARPSRAVVGLALLLPGMLLGGRFWFGEESAEGGVMALLGIVLTMAMFAGMATLAPFLVMPVVRLLGRPFKALFPAGGRLAVDALRANPMRTAATAAALMIGLSVVVVNASISSSWSGTIRDQIDQTFARDFTVQARGYGIEDGGGPGVPHGFTQEIAAMPEAAVATPVRSLIADLPQGGEQPGLVLAYDPALYGEVDTTPVREIPREQALGEVLDGGVLLGTAYAKAAGLERGDVVRLAGPRGRVEAPVVGTLGALDEFGGHSMQMSLRTMEWVYGNPGDAQIAVKARSERDREVVERRIDELVASEYPNLEMVSAAERQETVEEEISAQFNMFNAMVAIAVLVSLLGVVNTLAMSVIERTREIGVLRALGSSRWQVRRTMLDESLLITISGALAGLLLGTIIGYLWMQGLGDVLPGMSFRFPATTVFGVAILAVVLGVIGSVLPARRAARLDVLQALKYE